jgi:transcriptional regulator with XRE-family HTH domain
MARIAPKHDAIWSYLKAENISRDELARRIGVDRATAYRVDEGKAAPSPKFIAGLMIATGKRFEDLFDIIDEAA